MRRGAGTLNTRTKLLLTYLLIGVIPIVLLGAYVASTTERNLIETATNDALRNAERVQYHLVDMMDSALAVSTLFIDSTEIRNILSRSYASPWDLISTYFDLRFFDSILSVFEDLDQVRIYAENPELLSNWRFMAGTASIRETAWFRAAEERSGRPMFAFMEFPETFRQEPALAVVREIRTAKGARLGILIVKLKAAKLRDVFQHERFQVTVTDERGLVVVSSDPQQVGSSLTEYDGRDLASGKIAERLSRNGDDIVKTIDAAFTYEPTGETYMIRSVFSLRDIYGATLRLSDTGFLLILLSLAITGVTMFLFSLLISRRIMRVGREVHRVAEGNFDEVRILPGDDEIAQLSRDLRMMAESLGQKERLQRRQNEMQFRLLANQIRPHFLFNTLESIRMKAHSSGNREVAEQTKLLGKLLRANMRTGKDPISLGTELELARNYLSIQLYRFGDRLSYRIEVPEQLLAIEVLPFLIQPLVENSIVHGIELKKDPVSITISARETGNFVVLRVHDDGLGIESEALERIRDSFTEENEVDAHIGLRNVFQRMRLFYGPDADVVLESEAGRGTTVELVIPDPRGPRFAVSGGEDAR